MNSAISMLVKLLCINDISIRCAIPLVSFNIITDHMICTVLSIADVSSNCVSDVCMIR